MKAMPVVALIGLAAFVTTALGDAQAKAFSATTIGGAPTLSDSAKAAIASSTGATLTTQQAVTARAALSSLLQHKTDFVISARPLSHNASVREIISSTVIPYELVASKDIGVTNLSTEVIRQIFSGKITKWREVSPTLRDEAITLVEQDPDADVSLALTSGLLNNSRPITSQLVEMADDGVRADVEGHSGALGYGLPVSFQGANVVALRIDNYSVANVTANYHFYTQPFLYANASTRAGLTAFIAKAQATVLAPTRNAATILRSAWMSPSLRQ